MRDGNQNEDSKSRDFLGALAELDDLTPTNKIAENVGCSVEGAREWLFKLEDEGELVRKPKENKGIVCAMK